MEIAYEFNRDLNMFRRKVYGLLDFLGDIGGLAGSLSSIFAGLIIFFRYKAAINYVSNRLFLIKDGDEIDPSKRKSNTYDVDEFGIETR